jgi:hypothetical protein
MLIGCVVGATGWVLLLQRFSRVMIISSLVVSVIGVAAAGIALISHGVDRDLS